MSVLSRVVSLFILLTFVLCAAGLYLHPGVGLPWRDYFDGWFFSVLQFSIVQALLSSAISVVVALPFSWVLARKPFQYQWALKGLLNLFFIMPVLVIILGVVTAYSDWLNVFSLKGILLAHLYLNVPFAIRMIWQSLENISGEYYRLGSTMGFGRIHAFRWIELPVLLQAIRPVFVLIFILCFSSFTVVLTLGGGPENTNLEVAIFQALKLDFDPKAGVVYACAHIAIVALVIAAFKRQTASALEFSRQSISPKGQPNFVQVITVVLLVLVLVYPLYSLASSAFSVGWIGSTRLFEAMLTSLLIAIFSALLSILLALGRAFSSQNRFTQLIDFGLLILPVMVVITGLFLLALRLGIAFRVTHVLIVWVNSLMAMPLIIPALRNRIESYKNRYSPLCDVLGMPSGTQLRLVYWPAIRSILPWSFALSVVLSVGDLGVGVMVGSASFITLPILIYQAIGSYQMVLASQLTLLLLLLCALILFIAEWTGEKQAHVKG